MQSSKIDQNNYINCQNSGNSDKNDDDNNETNKKDNTQNVRNIIRIYCCMQYIIIRMICDKSNGDADDELNEVEDEETERERTKVQKERRTKDGVAWLLVGRSEKQRR